jgi:hypothetical protein
MCDAELSGFTYRISLFIGHTPIIETKFVGIMAYTMLVQSILDSAAKDYHFVN